MSVLSLLILLPVFAGGLLAMGYLRSWSRMLGLGVAAIASWRLHGVWQQFEGNLSGMQFREFRPLFGSVSASWNLGLDGWNIVALLSAVLVMVAMVIAADDDERPQSGWVLLLSACVIGVLLSLNLVLTLFFLLVFVLAIAFALSEERSVAQSAIVRQWLGGGGLMWVLLVALAGWLYATGSDGSFNFAAILRQENPYSVQVRQFALGMVGVMALAGIFPFSGWHERVVRHLPMPVAIVFLTASGAMALMISIRLLLPAYQEVISTHQSLLVLLAAGLAIYSGAVAWVRDDLRGQLTHMVAAATALALAGLLLLKTRGALGAVTFSGPYFMALAAAGVLCLWLERTVGGAADWWVVKHQVPKSPSLRFYALLVFFVLGAFPLAAAFPGALLMLLEVGDQAIRGIRAEGAYGPTVRAGMFLVPLLVFAGIASQYIWFVGQKRAAQVDFNLSPRVREVAALLVLLGFVFYWGVKPQLLSRSAESAISYTYKQRLSGERPVRAPVVETVPEEEAEAAPQ